MTPSECLSLAWTHCAPNRLQSAFPRGFWPDVARVAMEMYAQQTTTPKLDFKPTMCGHGDYPVAQVKRKSSVGLDLGKLEINL